MSKNMESSDSSFVTHIITGGEHVFLKTVINDICAAIKKRNEELNSTNDLSDASSIAISLLSLVCKSCPEGMKKNFKLAMIHNIQQFHDEEG